MKLSLPVHRPHRRGVLLGLLGALAVWLALGGPPLAPRPALAAAFTVTSVIDEPDATPGDGLCVSAPGGVCTLRAAIMEANATAGPDIITLPVGDYPLVLTGAGEDAALRGDLDITGDLTITGAGKAATIVRATTATDLDRVFHIRNRAKVTIQQLTIRDGLPPLPGGGDGGCILVDAGANLTLANALVTRCFTGGVGQDSGGGIAVFGQASLANVEVTQSGGFFSSGGIAVFPGGSLNMSGGRVEENFALRGGGGGLGIDGYAALTNVSITNNMVTIGFAAFGGGGIGVGTSAALVTVTGGAITNNFAAGFLGGGNLGGGVLNGKDAGPIAAFQTPAVQLGGGTVRLFSLPITGNTAFSISEFGTTADGGGIYTGGGGTTLLSNVNLSNNTAGSSGEDDGPPTGGRGGGLFNEGAGYSGGPAARTVVGSSTVSANRAFSGVAGGAGEGGGIWSGGPLAVTASTVSGNTAQLNGGGIFHASLTGAPGRGGSLVVAGSTISGNTAEGGYGGGINSSAVAPHSTQIVNSTISGNTVPAVPGGGGSGVEIALGTATISHTTITNNNVANVVGFSRSTTTNNISAGAASDGGALRVWAPTTTVLNTIIANQAAGHGRLRPGRDRGAIASTGGNFQSAAAATCPGFTAANPLLAPLLANGGPTLTHRPQVGSPAIDGGLAAGCLPVDQRGVARPQDGAPPAGAVCDAGRRGETGRAAPGGRDDRPGLAQARCARPRAGGYVVGVRAEYHQPGAGDGDGGGAERHAAVHGAV
ncbi:MAG: choice-of-anchor Q domain-containing protein [Dehalococcoidia bacterium]